MRKLYILLFTLAAACCLIGCTRENVEETTGSGDVIIRLKVDALETKSAANEDENYVENLQLLFFKNVSAAPTKYLNLTSEITAGVGPFEKSYATVTAFGDFTYTELKDAVVFAVANYATDLSTVSSLSDAKSKVVDASGFLVDSDGWKVKDGPRFVMTAEGGFGTGTGTDAGKAVADLTLRRLASKVSLRITYDSIDPPITTEDVANKTITAWTPMSEGNVRVYLSNAVNNAKLEGNADTPGLFTYADNHPTGEGTLSSSAFYTYPTSWAEGSDDAPFIKIIQPWSYKTVKYTGTSSADPGDSYVIDENVVELYYKVLFPGITALASNTWYKPTVTLNVLGGESNRNMVELSTTGFDILPWGSVSSSGGELSAIEIEPAKYIAVERENTIVNNGGTVSIKYVASGATTLTVEKIHKMVYGNNEMIEREIYPTKDALVNDDYVDDGGTGSIASGSSSDPWFGNSYGDDLEKPNEGIITLKHKLSTDYYESDGVTPKSNFAARPYIYKLKLHLNGESTDLDKTFYITQNPAIIVNGDLSDGYVNVNDHVAYLASGAIRSTGYLYVYTAPSYVHPDAMNTNAYNLGNNTNGTASFHNKNIKIHNIYYDPSPNAAGYRYGTSTSSAYLETNHSFGYRYLQCNLGQAMTYAYLPHFNGTTNKCEYRILVSFSSRDGYYIIDPRIAADKLSTEDNFLYKTLNYSTVKNGSTERAYSPFSDVDDADNAIHKAVKKYSPTKRVGAEKMIAPEIMVASSYGRTTAVFYEGAVLRCASYQEDGYPAGRWRVPTEAEIENLVELSNKGAMPSLFDGEYFASSGRYYHSGDEKFYRIKSNNNNPVPAIISDTSLDTNPNASYDDYRHSVRCVYDTWYWGREPVTTTSDGTTPIKPGTKLTITQTRNSKSSSVERNLYNWSGFMPTK